jgi:glycosyltransferase involved in cell wall biosynthesis
VRIGLVLPGFSAEENDWCIPALLNYVRALAEGAEVEVFALRYPPRRDVYRIGKARVYSLGWGQKRGVRSAMLLASAIKLIAHCHSQKKFDLLHAFWADEPGAVAACFSDRVPIVISLAGGELINLPQIEYGVFRHFHARHLIGWALRRASLVTAGSKYLAEIAQSRLAQGRVLVAPLGVDLAMWRSQPLPNQAITLLSVASLEPVKGHEILLRAFRQVVDRFPAARLKIAGDGSLKTALQNRARELGVIDQVEFCGKLAHHHLPELYRSATMFVQSSLYESQGMALLEAAASGLPLVGTQVGVLAELAPDAAVAVAVGDSEKLAEAMISLLCDPQQAASLGRAARARVESEYGLDRTLERFTALYRSLII